MVDSLYPTESPHLPFRAAQFGAVCLPFRRKRGKTGHITDHNPHQKTIKWENNYPVAGEAERGIWGLINYEKISTLELDHIIRNGLTSFSPIC